MTTNAILVVHVQVRVKPTFLDAFLAETRENARGSIEEPGVLRFDVVQDREDETRFVLVEIFRDVDAQLAHRQTAHYARWRAAVEPMMAEPRSARQFAACYPDLSGF